ncbi:3-hydroxyacyl-CoA dehydrogenase NAD-binding domain-containing protein [Rhizobium sp. SSA_523]|uniref:3-hydroxyacyl-CoA dehydrogenase NAD-binding domain-containing protein n=1 Tax=Rhizobium sp. SSA_523 TaxID=2952477 RepID=UPI0020909D75|nr:3-hydroxyacyl-CoA dehydrogenase NAD-binding domain-containing protein [Rhizobium sp. SSA_523]MCO5733855.1 3-hydroxyacyl-CoA dehydrogenase NAD-binding domain-containing protein [Rhizobium sp. SSA_523]WKC24878.1 3-hydroxyacyl-CoA dehydrogenase NAD-binding domain-containing protein [Rhizobium sp. SSA_523]
MSSIAFSPSVSGEERDGILVVTIDNPPVNALSAHVRQGLMAALSHTASGTDIAGMVLSATGQTFVGGADIREFGQAPVEPSLPALIDAVENAQKPVIAALNGAALGGGLELALACHARIALPSVGIALPEVKLGLVPGAGGTQRLPRLIGAIAALEVIASGRRLEAAEAQTLGILDAVIADDLVSAAIALARQLAPGPLRRTGRLPAPAINETAYAAAADAMTRKARGQIAPAEIVNLVRLACTQPLEDALAQERATFLRLRDGDQSKALRHVFFAEREAGKVADLDGVAPRPLQAIGIVGLGLMGSGIAAAALAAGYRVVGLEQTTEAAANGRERILALLERSVKSGRLSPQARDAQRDRLSTSAEDSALCDCDLVIEAVFDELQVKVDLFRRLDHVLRPDAILATNTSYLDPDEIAAATARPDRVMGLHFFSPAHVMRLLEVVRCRETAPDVLATGLAFAKRLKKLAIVTGVTKGFIGNRIFSAYRREAEFLIEDGALPHEIDAALEGFGFPMGLFAVNDMTGLDIAWARRKREAATRDPAARYVDIADRLCEAGRLGQKTGRGWYLYIDGKRQVDPDVTAIIAESRAAKAIAARSFSADEILDRLLAAMTAEGQALIEEGIAARESDIDLVMINGYGFPAHAGGPMYLHQRKRQQP